MQPTIPSLSTLQFDTSLPSCLSSPCSSTSTSFTPSRKRHRLEDSILEENVQRLKRLELSPNTAVPVATAIKTQTPSNNHSTSSLTPSLRSASSNGSSTVSNPYQLSSNKPLSHPTFVISPSLTSYPLKRKLSSSSMTDDSILPLKRAHVDVAVEDEEVPPTELTDWHADSLSTLLLHDSVRTYTPVVPLPTAHHQLLQLCCQSLNSSLHPPALPQQHSGVDNKLALVLYKPPPTLQQLAGEAAIQQQEEEKQENQLSQTPDAAVQMTDS